MKENIIVFCAHSDDESIGVGSTIAKFAKEGKKIIIVIFSLGEKSQPHLKERYIINLRKKEIEKISKFLGSKKVIFLDIKDGMVSNNIDNKLILDKIEEIIRKYKPNKIFVHSRLDPHIDHRGVNKIVTKIIDNIKYKGDVYSFEVWNVIKEDAPVMYVDITDYFKKKIEAMKMFKSQWHFVYPLMLPVYWRAFSNGMRNKCKYAEKFYKIK